MKIMNLLSMSVALVLAVVIPTVQAHAESAAVSDAMKQLDYTLSVEWDQKDASVKQAAMQKFYAQLSDAVKAGSSPDDIFNALTSQTLSPQAAKDMGAIKDLFKVGKISVQDAQKQALDYMNKAQASGVNWNSGGTEVAVVVAVLLIVVVIAACGGNVVVTANVTTCVDSYDAYGNYLGCF